MRCVVFELAGGGTYVPLPGRAKVAQTPGRARVKNSSSHVLDATSGVFRKSSRGGDNISGGRHGFFLGAIFCLGNQFFPFIFS